MRMFQNQNLSRRDFLKLAGLGLGTLALRPLPSALVNRVDFPSGDLFGRVLALAEVKSQPDVDSKTVGKLYEDNLVPWLREVSGRNANREVQRWVETPDGYLWAPRLQLVRNLPNVPVETLPKATTGQGAWVEVTVPFVDIVLENPPARSPWLKSGPQYQRLYYSQVVWVDQIKQGSDGLTYYRVNELYGSYGDRFWADARAFRIITPEEIAPISPEVEDKHVEVDVTYQTLSCFEGKNEVFFARVSTGAKFNDAGEAVDKWATPQGTHHTWRKIVSLHMAGGTASGGYDLPGIAWTVLFASGGVAIHSTFWHNNYGVPMSHGCVNTMPEDAKWIFRWTSPTVQYDPGDLTIQMPGGTPVHVYEG